MTDRPIRSGDPPRGTTRGRTGPPPGRRPRGRAAWLHVFRKELRETLRDRRTLIAMLVIPVLLYPVLLIAVEQLALLGQRRLEAEPVRVALGPGVPGELRDLLDESEEVDLVGLEGPPDQAVRTGADIAIVLRSSGAGTPSGGPPDTAADPDGATLRLRLVFDGADERSRRGRFVVGGIVQEWSDTLLERRLAERGLPRGFARPIAVADTSVALPEEVGGDTLGRFLPMILVVITLLGAFYPAIDLGAGEKERGTLETLLTAPVDSRSVVLGKFATVTVIALAAAALNLTSMLLTVRTGLVQLGPGIGASFALPWWALPLIGASLVPLAVLFGSLFLGVSVRARSTKEAQNALTPVYMLALVPALLPLFPGIDLTPGIGLIPVAGIGLLFRELMVGELPVVAGGLALWSTGIAAYAALRFAAASFGREGVLFGDEAVERPGLAGDPLAGEPAGFGRSPGGPIPIPAPRHAFGFVVAVAALFFFVGTRLQIGLGEAGIFLSEWFLLFVPALAFVLLLGFEPRETFAFRAPTRLGLLAALLVIVGGTPLAWFLAWLQSFVIPIPYELIEQVEALLRTDDPFRLAWLVVLIALTPAICEEVVFRGILLTGTRRHFSTRAVVLANALVFGAFHLSFETAFRFLPTAWLGGLLAYTVLRTRSIWTGALMHFLNNAVVVVLAAVPSLDERFADPNAPPPLFLFPLALVSFLIGLRLLREDGARAGRPRGVAVGEGPTSHPVPRAYDAERS